MLSELLVCWFIIKYKYFQAFWKDQYRVRLSSYFKRGDYYYKLVKTFHQKPKRGEIYKEILLFEWFQDRKEQHVWNASGMFQECFRNVSNLPQYSPTTRLYYYYKLVKTFHTTHLQWWGVHNRPRGDSTYHSNVTPSDLRTTLNWTSVMERDYYPSVNLWKKLRAP